MKRFFVLGCLILSLGVAGAAQLVPPFEHGPYAGAPTRQAVTISWLLPAPMPAILAYAPAGAYAGSGEMSVSVPVPAGPDPDPRTTQVRLDGLEPDTEYVYQVTVQSGSQTVTSPVGRFHTEPPPGEPVRFAVLSDTQWQWDGPNRLAWVGDAIAQDADANGNFDFILHGGDLVESPSITYWTHWFASFETMLLRAPFLPVLGNHERNTGRYYEYFTLPSGGGRDNERWWALHWGDLVVVGLDTNASSVPEMRAQQAWLEQELSGPEIHKFVIFHHPVFSSDAYHGSGYSYDVIYHPIFVKHGVDIVFNGHAHNYERIVRDGVTYLVVGGGGATPRALAEAHVEGSIVAIPDHNFYVTVETHPDRIDVRVVSVARVEGDTATPTPGEILDAFSLPSRGSPPADRTASPAVPNWALLAALTALAAIGLWVIARMSGS